MVTSVRKGRIRIEERGGVVDSGSGEVKVRNGPAAAFASRFGAQESRTLRLIGPAKAGPHASRLKSHKRYSSRCGLIPRVNRPAAQQPVARVLRARCRILVHGPPIESPAFSENVPLASNASLSSHPRALPLIRVCAKFQQSTNRVASRAVDCEPVRAGILSDDYEQYRPSVTDHACRVR